MRRVLISGMGQISPHGNELDSAFKRVCAGESAIAKVHVGPEGRETDLLLACVDDDPEAELTPLEIIAMDPTAQFGVVAARRALAQSDLLDRRDLLEPAAVYFGASYGGSTFDQANRAFYGRGTRRLKPTTIPRIMPNATAAQISMEHGIGGPSHTYSVACVSSAAAIGEAFRAIRDGYLECAVVGGSQAALAEPLLSGWQAMSVLATEHPDGAGASVRPFDVRRSGFALGEGAAVLVLECDAQLEARGGTALAEIVGYGASSDAVSITKPSLDGQVRCMLAALSDAGVPEGVVGYINAHATGTKVGDVIETRAIKEAFGDHARRLAVSSTKALHGHLVEASGALELAITIMALREGRVPPTGNLEDPDPECDLDYVPLRGREVSGLEYAMSNSFGFGGSNVSLLVRRVGDS